MATLLHKHITQTDLVREPVVELVDLLVVAGKLLNLRSPPRGLPEGGRRVGGVRGVKRMARHPWCGCVSRLPPARPPARSRRCITPPTQPITDEHRRAQTSTDEHRRATRRKPGQPRTPSTTLNTRTERPLSLPSPPPQHTYPLSHPLRRQQGYANKRLRQKPTSSIWRSARCSTAKTSQIMATMMLNNRMLLMM